MLPLSFAFMISKPYPRKGTEIQHRANSMKKEQLRFRLTALFVLLYFVFLSLMAH